MFIVDWSPVAVALCVNTMLFMSSWAKKLASKGWRSQLAYGVYAIPMFLLSLLMAFTMGRTGSLESGFLAALQQSESQ